jgi:Ni/Fe-hydrogenase subunit HybB-like protein
MNRNGLFLSALLVVLGFILNRLNISVTGMEASSGVSYFPSWMEVMLTVAIVTFGFVVFALTIRYFPVFAGHESKPVATKEEGYETVSVTEVAELKMKNE